ncbi:MAG: M28 family peptidase [Elusimicrobia bacterium]|nr:M28 family peptidase [Elusimicrobiota bacterium]
MKTTASLLALFLAVPSHGISLYSGLAAPEAAPRSGALWTPPAAEIPRLLRSSLELFAPGLGEALLPAVAAAKPGFPDGIPPQEELLREMRMSPLTNKAREEAVIGLLRQAGADAQKIVTIREGETLPLNVFDTVIRQEAGDGKYNYYVVKEGRGDALVVSGAHHDKVSVGAGTIDNWGGSTLEANVYEVLRLEALEATHVMALFAREEEGLLGSKAWLAAAWDFKDRVKAMLNLDTFSVDGTFSWKNNSTPWMLALVKEVALRQGLDLTEAVLRGGDSDSSTFRDAGISGMTLYGCSQRRMFDIIHTSRDTMAVFSLPHYVNALKLAVAFLRALDSHPFLPDVRMNRA